MLAHCLTWLALLGLHVVTRPELFHPMGACLRVVYVSIFSVTHHLLLLCTRCHCQRSEPQFRLCASASLQTLNE